MNMFKMALLGGAALAVSAAGAQADDLTALKAQIESLNARVATMEAAPSVPAGYQLLTIKEGSQQNIPGLETLRKDAVAQGDTATVISVMPTADAPAATEITWSGYARAAIVYGKDTVDVVNARGLVTSFDDDLDVLARGQIKVSGKTETAVGEVGATVEFRGNFDGRRIVGVSHSVYIEQAWGYWAMTPELTLGGGFAGSLSNIGYGYDGACNCYYTDNANVALNPGDTSQMRLSYASGPISFAIALEDASGGAAGNMFGGGDSLGAAGEIKYAGDMFSGEISGGWRDGGNFGADPFQVGIGGSVGLDMITVSAGAAMGQYNNGTDFWRASILASANLSDEVHAEVAYGHTQNDGPANEVDAVLAGLYYDPVSQLTIGLEGEWIADDSHVVQAGPNRNKQYDTFQVDLVTVFRF